MRGPKTAPPLWNSTFILLDKRLLQCGPILPILQDGHPSAASKNPSHASQQMMT